MREISEKIMHITPHSSNIPDYHIEEEIVIHQSAPLSGEVEVFGAKNAVLVAMASLLLVSGKSILNNVPNSEDVRQMMGLLQELGARTYYDVATHRLEVDTTHLVGFHVRAETMKKMRASVLVAGPLLARFGRVDMALPGGDLIGARPIDFHLKNFEKMGASFFMQGETLSGIVHKLLPARLVLEYPSVGATENLMMAAVLTKGITKIVNAALEPEVIDLMELLKAMGACIYVEFPATIVIEGVSRLEPVEYTIVGDRLEVGTLLLAAAITQGSITIPNAQPHLLDVFLFKLEEMGHVIERGVNSVGVSLKATTNPRAVSLRTMPYPGFPTDLQAPMVAVLALASGSALVQETVYENRFLHVRELQKMGAQIQVDGEKALVKGVESLYGTRVIASDIRAAAALVLAGLAAKGTTIVTGVHHWRRGYEALEERLALLGASILVKNVD